MMAPQNVMQSGAGVGAASLLATAELIAAARQRVWIVQFAIDARPEEDGALAVRGLLNETARAVERGVDVRVVLPVLKRAPMLTFDGNLPAAQYLAQRRVRVRHYAPDAVRPFLHSKYVLVDGTAVVGSANWTPRAFSLNVEVGAVTASGLAVRQLEETFDRLWEAGRELSAGPRLATRRDEDCGCGESQSPRSEKSTAIVTKREAQNGSSAWSAPSRSDAIVVAGQPYLRRLLEAIGGARERVWVWMFGLAATRTRRLRDLLPALTAAHKRGVDVRIIYDGRGEFRNVWAADAATFDAHGVPARPWPLLTRMHARAALVDANHSFVGSVGWTPQSVFRTEETTIHTVGKALNAALADYFATCWSLADQAPSSWRIDALFEADPAIATLRTAGVTELAQLRAEPSLPWVDAPGLRACRIAAGWVEKFRYAPPIAMLLGRAGITSLARFRAGASVAEIDRELRTAHVFGGVLAGVAGTYVQRRLLGKEV